MIRAVSKAGEYLKQYDYHTGDDRVDQMTREDVRQLVEAIQDFELCSSTFNETSLFLADKVPITFLYSSIS